MDVSLLIGALLGAVVLFFGRKLFWLFVAAVGFAVGVELAPHLLQQPTPLLQLTIALVLGFVGALLAVLLQKLAVGVVGFLAGGRLALALAATFFVHAAGYYWLIFLLGGVLGAVLLLFLFDWALIVLSAFIGAHLIVHAIPLPTTGAAILLIVLAVFGIVVQATSLRRGRVVAD